MIEYKEIDENGFVVDTHVLEDWEKPLRNYIKGWGGEHSFFSPRWDFYNEKWTEGTSDVELLNKLRAEKDTELNQACASAILNGFDFAMDGVTYHFSYDNEAQVNFQETYTLFQNSVINDVMWTVTLGEGKFRLFLNKERFTQVYYASIQHKFRCIKYYRDKLTPLLTSATTYDMINNIVWDSSVYEDVAISTNNTIDNKIEALASESQMTMMALIELSGMVMA